MAGSSNFDPDFDAFDVEYEEETLHDSNSSSEDDLLQLEEQMKKLNKAKLSRLQAYNRVLQEGGGSVEAPPRRRRRVIERDREAGHDRLFADYFAESPTYSPEMFRLRFRMRRSLFLRIMEALTSTDRYFVQRTDALGRMGLTPHQKCTAAIRVLGYGMAADAVDEYLRLSETVARDSLVHFVEGVIANFGNEYLRRPTAQDMQRLLAWGEQRGFPGMLGSIDCMHWTWKNCPTAWAGQYSGRSKKPTIILEAVASADLWIWHAFFGTPGSLNDINVLDRSPVFDDVLNGRAPQVNFTVNGRTYSKGYYLTDGIYPSWATFVKAYPTPVLQKQNIFNTFQEGVRKDVERAFGVLQARFAFLRHPCLLWDKFLMAKVMIACIILHNMIVEDERETYPSYRDPTEFMQDLPPQVDMRIPRGRIASLENYMANRDDIRDARVHTALREDLTEHIFRLYR